MIRKPRIPGTDPGVPLEAIPAEHFSCKLTHYDFSQALPVLAAADFARLVFTNIGDQRHCAEAAFSSGGIP